MSAEGIQVSERDGGGTRHLLLHAGRDLPGDRRVKRRRDLVDGALGSGQAADIRRNARIEGGVGQNVLCHVDAVLPLRLQDLGELKTVVEVSKAAAQHGFW